MAALPALNVSDIPEMLPGARPRANPAARFRFEERCKALRREDMEELVGERPEAEARAAAGGDAAVGELVAMFPHLDASLVRSLAADAPTPRDTLSTLMALSVTAGPMPEPAAGGAGHLTEEEEAVIETSEARPAAGRTGAVAAELEAMFPTLEASLVRSLAAEAPTLQRAVETLIAIAAATAEPAARLEPPARDVGAEDLISFPHLATTGGAGLPSRPGPELSNNAEASTAWRDRAMSAAALPEPAAAACRPVGAQAPRRASAPGRRSAATDPDSELFAAGPDEYELRRERGQRRARRMAQHRAARCAAKGHAVAAAGQEWASPDTDANDPTQ